MGEEIRGVIVDYVAYLEFRIHIQNQEDETVGGDDPEHERRECDRL